MFTDKQKNALFKWYRSVVNDQDVMHIAEHLVSMVLPAKKKTKKNWTNEDFDTVFLLQQQYLSFVGGSYTRAEKISSTKVAANAKGKPY